jgi:hypothetical protein
MTGRKLYDLLCDAYAEQGTWGRQFAQFFPGKDEPIVAWAFLSQTERRAFSRAAAKATPKRRTA